MKEDPHLLSEVISQLFPFNMPQVPGIVTYDESGEAPAGPCSFVEFTGLEGHKMYVRPGEIVSIYEHKPKKKDDREFATIATHREHVLLPGNARKIAEFIAGSA